MQDCNRYDRQIILPNFGQMAQEKLTRARVLVVGAGGLGLPVLMYLAAAGVGRIEIIDGDRVAASNLNRQVLYCPEDIGKYKVEVAQKFLSAQNPTIQIIAHIERLTNKNALAFIENVDLVVDGSDNLATRYIIDDACRLLGKAWIFGAVFRYQGQVAVFNSPRLLAAERCVYRDWAAQPTAETLACAEAGVLGALTGIIGGMQAMEAIKYLAEIGENKSSKITIYDALAQEVYNVALLPNLKSYGNFAPQTVVEFLAFDYVLHCKKEIVKSYKITTKSTLRDWQAAGRDFWLIDLRSFSSQDEEDEDNKEADFLAFRVLRLPFERYYSGVALPVAADLVFYCQRGRRAAFVAAEVARRTDFGANIWVLEGE
jgi:adenylyltransferase/sulfurtransferase